MAKILRFPHARASTGAGSAAPSFARASRVISGTPFSDASRTSGSQCAAGMPRPREGSRQQLTVGSASESASATAFVPPRASITKSDVIMDGTIVCAVQTCQGFATRKTTFLTECDAIGSMMDPSHIIAARLKALRLELGFKSQVAFAVKRCRNTAAEGSQIGPQIIFASCKLYC